MKILNINIISIGFISLTLIACKKNLKDSRINNKYIHEKHIEKLPTVNIKANDQLVSPITITVNSEGIWNASEGVLGFVELIDDNGYKLTSGVLKTNENWMTNQPVVFFTKLTFNPNKRKNGVLIIHNDSGEGDKGEAGKKRRFKIPVKF